MGEWSKSLGEKGEKIAKFVFEDILGINSLEENVSIRCSYGEKHQRKEAQKKRTTHGIDGLFYFESPLEDELLDKVLVSVKYSDEYPKNPRTQFVKFITRLSKNMECFPLSQEDSKINLSFNNVTKSSYTGILVWLSNKDPVNFELIPKIAKTQISHEMEFEKIIVLDNARINFLYQTIYKTKKEKGKVEFVYHDTSLNQGYLNKRSFGDHFPINYLYSDVIILRIEEKQEIELIIFINDNFNDQNLSQVLAFANSFDHLKAVAKTTICFLNYNSLEHENQVKRILNKFSGYKLHQNLYVTQFPLDFRQS